MSAFTVCDEAGEVYASTIPYMRSAIEVLNETCEKIGTSHGALAQDFDNLLPIELKNIGYLPAEKVMRNWVNVFFANSSRGGLVPTLAEISGTRFYSDGESSQPAGWRHEAGDLRFAGVMMGRYASAVKTIRRMHDFLSWIPDGSYEVSDHQTLLSHCITWADAFKQENAEDNWYGHLVAGTSWRLHNFVQAGPPRSTVLESPELEDPRNFPEDFHKQAKTFNPYFDLALRFALEGFPDSGWVMVQDYGAVALSFMHLAKVSAMPQYAKFAEDVTVGLWQARLNHDTYLMPDTVTPGGPLPGDQIIVDKKSSYTHDTDCLYWARALFAIYGLLRRWRSDLAPTDQDEQFCDPPDPNDPHATLSCLTRLRRLKLQKLFQEDFPAKCLGMALGLTVDWIDCGWDPAAKQFIRKICHDGTRGPTEIYGDGKWNTLYVLVDAYRFTHDDFYLDIFNQAWQQLQSVAGGPGNLLPHALVNGGAPVNPAAKQCWGDGAPPAPPGVECNQAFFLDVVVRAYLASVRAGKPRNYYLAYAQALADKILAEYEAGRPYFRLDHGIIGGALIRLAQARGTMRRIAIKLDEDNIAKLGITGSAGTTDVALFGHKRAVVYMDTGDYEVTKHFSGNNQPITAPLKVTIDTEVTL